MTNPNQPSAPASSPPAAAVQPQQFNDEKKHYESLISLFKWCIGCLSFLAAVISYLTYNSVKDFKESIKSEIDSERADLEKKSKKLEQEAKDFKDEMQKQVQSAKERAVTEIANVQEVAKVEAREKIDQVFQQKQLDVFIEDVAKKHISPKVELMVNKAFQVIQEKLNQSFDHILTGLHSSNNLTYSNALSQLNSMSDSDLDEGKIDKIIDIVKSNSVNGTVSFHLYAFLANKDFDVVYKFFRSEILRTSVSPDPGAFSAIRTYILVRVLTKDKPEDKYLLESAICQSKNTEICRNILGYSGLYNSGFLRYLLESKKVTDHLNKTFDKEKLTQLKLSVQGELSNSLPGKDFSKTTFFNSLNQFP